MLQVLTKNASNFKGYLFRRGGDGTNPEGQNESETRVLDEQQGYQILRCTACGHPVSYVEAICERQGSHEHVQVNPHGATFVFGCFSTAPGTRPASEPVSEFSWFPGYWWQIVLCENCEVHLGWRFGSEQDEFFGLLLNMLQSDQ